MQKAFAIIALSFTGALFATSTLAASDDFNRSSLGNKWVVPSGSLYITADQLQGDSLSIGYFKKSKKDNSATVTAILNGTDTQYSAIAIGDIASGNNAFVKIQDNGGDSTFGYGGFYIGNNGGGDFFALDSAVASPAKMSVTFCGTVATLTIKSASGKQKYSYDYGTTYPNGAGLGIYGVGAMDDYSSKSAGCKDTIGSRVIHHDAAAAKDPTVRQ